MHVTIAISSKPLRLHTHYTVPNTKASYCKGQLITERLFWRLKLSKTPTQKFDDFDDFEDFKKLSNQQNKGTFLILKFT